MERGERAELFGDDERGVIGQHDAACADANARGAGGDVADHHRRRRTGDARHVVMLRQPEPVVAQGFDVAREGERVRRNACRGVAAGDDGRQI